MGLADQLAEKYKDSNGSLSVYLMPPEVDRRLKQISQGVWEKGDLAPAQDAWLESLRDALWREVRNASMEMRRTPLLAPAGLRLPLRGWLGAEFPSLPVLSYHEIPMGINVTPISRIEV
jgi:flagellar biosynthesis component FlhA